MRLSFLLILAAVAALAACGTAEQKATYTPPATPGGRLCTHQCGEAQDFCHQSCSLDHRQCAMTEQAQAMRDYDAYTREQFRQQKSIELLPRDFENATACTDDHEDCDSVCGSRFQNCYATCGGRVNVESSCQFFCF